MILDELGQLIRRTPVFTVANGLSLLRLMLLLPVYLLLRESQDAVPLAAIILVGLGWMSDGLDGYMARRLDQVSELGKILDPVVDKIFVLTLLVMLTVLRDFPPWLLAVIIPRDVIILWGGLHLARRRKTVEKSGLWGKITTNLLIATVVVYMTNWNELVPGLMALVVLAMAMSTWHYARFFFRALGESA
jgi:CDP-diacylglycerol--glycerol-3-phosphate 3-phosphatidyltransferase